MDIIDLEDEKIDAEVLDAMAVTQAHFKFAMGLTNKKYNFLFIK